MDPITAIGAAASSLQLAGFVFQTTLQTIQFVKDLRDVPAKLKVTLADVAKSLEGLSYLQSELTKPSSKVLSLLDSSQVLRLTTVVENGHTATSVLHARLESVFGQQTASAKHSRLKAAWRSIVSLKMEKEVEEALKRIQRLNEEITRQVQIIQLECHADARLSAGYAVEVLDGRLTTESEMIREHISAALQKERGVSEAEMRSIRDALLSFTTGERHPTSATDQAIILKLSKSDMATLSQQMCEALVSYPGALSQSCETLLPMPGTGPQNRRVSRRSNTPSCVCVKNHVSRGRQLGGYIGLHHESRADHHPSCPYATYNERSWSYTLSLALTPLLSRTVAFSFGAKFQGGGFSVLPSLKVIATVPRSSSPMFQAFDRLERLCYPDWEVRTALGFTYLRCPCDRQLAREEIRNVQKSLQDMISSRTGCLTDRDEHGHTLLHEIAYVVSRAFPLDCRKVSELRYLFWLARCVGIDGNCAATDPTRETRLSLANRPTESYTAQDVISELLSSTRSLDLVSPDLFGPYLVEASAPLDLGSMEPETCHALCARYPELAELLGPLGPAVCRRSIKDLRTILASPSFNIQDYGGYLNLEEPIMWLAAPWHEGLPLLLTAGFSPQPAAVEALRQDDLRSLEVLAESPSWNPSELLTDASAASDALQQLVVDGIRRQHDRLYELCCRHLTPVQLSALQLPHLTPLDNYAWGAYMTLVEQGVVVPEELITISNSDAVFDIGYPLDFLQDRTLPLLEKLYAAGFRDINGVSDVDSGHWGFAFASALWEAALWGAGIHFADHVSLLLWLLEKAGSTPASVRKQWPNALFDAALFFGEIYEGNQGNWDSLRIILWAMVRYCDAMRRDSCDCFCSEHGCLPSRLFLQRKMPPEVQDGPWGNGRKTHGYEKPQDDRDKLVQLWCQSCERDKGQARVYAEDAVRVEIFGRLGMVHTCCHIPVERSYSIVGVLSQASPEERQQVQEEDAELNEQLETIMEAYRAFADRHVGSEEDLLKKWWPMVDQILPELSVAERRLFREPGDEIDTEVSDKRSALERELLARNGYGGLDFAEVIRRHFKEYLGFEETSLPDDVGGKQGLVTEVVLAGGVLGRSTHLPTSPSVEGHQSKGKRRNSF